jgi:hypothetical protein
MEQTITITLRRKPGGPPGVVDLAHNAHIFERDITKIEWRDKNTATTHTMGEWFEVSKVETSIER